jgi:hypothetical protein
MVGRMYSLQREKLVNRNVRPNLPGMKSGCREGRRRSCSVIQEGDHRHIKVGPSKQKKW